MLPGTINIEEDIGWLVAFLALDGSLKYRLHEARLVCKRSPKYGGVNYEFKWVSLGLYSSF